MKSIVEIKYRFFPFEDKEPTVAIKKITENTEYFYSCDRTLFPKSSVDIVRQVDRDIYICYYVSKYETAKEICNEKKFKKTMDNIKEYITNQYNDVLDRITTYEKAHTDYLKNITI